ncbi:nigwaprin-b isoform X2 [Bubalus bubalis]|uniref:nigwaprin-b isoform X2 n=1 Tax=Bubalus bubalis TaxID=89462 RepID=UPI000DBC636F|nr:nigwaprin-b isoform X2 [Bubalus bubalis]
MKLGGLFLLAGLLTLNTRLQAIGVCVEQCQEDWDCTAGEKCVSNGCGHVCSPAPQASTCINECREDRDCGVKKECLQVGCRHVCLPLATAAWRMEVPFLRSGAQRRSAAAVVIAPHSGDARYPPSSPQARAPQ